MTDDTPLPPEDGPESTQPRQEWRNFYGRRSGKTLRNSQRGYLDEDLDRLRPRGIGRDENPERSPLDLQTLFGNDNPVWLEVGFGGGEHLVHMAKTYPGINIIGCEPFINGVAMLLGKIREAGVSNLAVHPGDVRDLMDVLRDGTIARTFLNYPDPWPKARHHRRRFVNQDYLVPLFRVMAGGSEFRVATDIPSYMEQTLEEVPKAGFRLEAHSGTPWSDWISTRYEQKALREGRVPDYATFRR